MLTLFEPTIAIRYGFNKKTTAPIDLEEIFQPFATIPVEGISSDEDVIGIEDVPGFEVTFAEVIL